MTNSMLPRSVAIMRVLGIRYETDTSLTEDNIPPAITLMGDIGCGYFLARLITS